MNALPLDLGNTYQQALEREKRRFESCLNVHDLPEIFHYWSNRYIRPKLLSFGFDSPKAMFVKHLQNQCDEGKARIKRFVSLGSGNCELEIALAGELRASGHERFVIDCVDLNAAMLARGRLAADQAGLIEYLEFTQSDLNVRMSMPRCDAIIANQVLHHVLDLEGLFENVRQSLNAGGLFIISDMIGRNGHQRWPEALDIVHEFWPRLPPSYRLNLQLARYEELFEDWDCSSVGFEGIRSQDILPLLLRTFHFQVFFAFGNVIDPFVDRSFGPHFDAAAAWDRAFIDQIHWRDEAEISSHALTPTHMLAVVGTDSRATPAFYGTLIPERCVRGGDRRIDAATRELQFKKSGVTYEWPSWPHSPQHELEIACERLSTRELQLRKKTAHITHLEAELTNLEADLVTRTNWARGLEKELEDRTRWACSLERDLEQQTIWAINLQEEFHERSLWAQALQLEVEERTARVLQLDSELREQAHDLSQLRNTIHDYLHHPHRFCARLIVGCYRRLSGMRITMRIRFSHFSRIGKRTDDVRP